MTKFKVGDKVKVISVCLGATLRVGDVVEVDFIRGNLLYPKGKHSAAMLTTRFELVEETHFPLYSEEAAVKLLTERGYEVKVPPKPLKGRGVVYEYYGQKGVYHFINKDIFDKWPNPNSICRIVAIVDWTEGQGI